MKDKKTNPLWGGRFKEGVNEKASRFSSSVDLDRRLYKEDIDGSIVYAMALKEAKVITQKDYSKIKKGLLSVCKAIEDEKFEWNIALEDVHMNIESALQRKIGEPAKKLHTGRSRNDQVATDLRLFLMRNIDQMLNLITLTQKEIIKLAKRNHDAIMPGFTHTQIAQPVTLGHHLMAWNEMLERDYWRFSDVRKRTSILPLGSSALSGNSYGLDREKMAKRLGFDGEINKLPKGRVVGKDLAIKSLGELIKPNQIYSGSIDVDSKAKKFLFGNKESIKECVLVSLKTKSVTAILMLGSDTNDKYSPEKDSLFLEFISDVASSLIDRHNN